MGFNDFMQRFNKASDEGTSVTFMVDTPLFQIDGGEIDTISYIEYDNSVELHTEDDNHTILINKTDDVECEDDIYKFGELEIIFL